MKFGFLIPGRWFRFSLRTMFVVVTAFGLWLGLEVRDARQRADVLAWLGARRPLDKPLVTPGYDAAQNENNRWAYRIADSELSWFRRLLGDHFVIVIVHPSRATPEELQRVKLAFPEAVIHEWDGPVG